MEYKITPMQVGDRPEYTMPDPRILEVLGEEGVRALLSRFYDIVSEDDDIAHFFPEQGPELEMVKQHNADFFIQQLGGHKWFDERRGGKSMEQVHRRFSVTPKAREGWLHCMAQALDELDMDDELKLSLWNFLEVFSKHIVNVDVKKTGTYEEMVKV